MKRIEILDGLRVFAILAVIVSHYLLQYDLENHEVLRFISRNGYFGVPFFFIISGFVILYSLENTTKYSDYLKKRYLRLAPAMLICSLITFCFFYFIYEGPEYSNSKFFPNLLIANTFIDPYVFKLVSNNPKIDYIDGAYWSLWVEVCFYVIIGYLYFRNKKTFIRNYILLCILGIPFYEVLKSSLIHSYLQDYLSLETLETMKLVGRSLAFFHECLWFLIGIFLYKLYKNPEKKNYIYYIILTGFLLALLDKFNITFCILTSFTIAVYLIFVYKPKWLNYLTNPFVGKLGVSSYSVYLIHYHIGSACIIMYNNYIGGESYLILIILAICCFCFGLFSYKYLEKPLSNQLKKLLFKNKVSKSSVKISVE